MKREKKSTESFYVEVPIFNAEVNLFIGKRDCFSTWLSSAFEVKDTKIEEMAETADGLVFDLEDYGYPGHVGMFLNDFREKLETEKHTALGTLAHECVHAAKAVCESRGIPFDEENEELSAYLVGFLVQKILDKVEKAKKKS